MNTSALSVVFFQSACSHLIQRILTASPLTLALYRQGLGADYVANLMCIKEKAYFSDFDLC